MTVRAAEHVKTVQSNCFPGPEKQIQNHFRTGKNPFFSVWAFRVNIHKNRLAGYNLSMWKKIKELFKSTPFNIALIFALTGIVFYITVKDQAGEILHMFENADLRFILLIFVLLIGEKCLLGWGLATECQQSHPKYRVSQGIVNAYVAGLFNNITPGASGGQIAQGYIFKKQGIPYSNSIGVLWLDFIVYQSTMTIYVLLLLILRFGYFYSNYSQFFLIVIAGFVVSSAIIVFLWMLARSPRFYTWLTTTGINIGAKLRIVKDREATLNKLDEQLQAFGREIVVLQTHKKMIVQLAFITAARLTIQYSVPFFAAKALRISVGTDQLLNIISLSAFVSMVNAFLPMPGSSGGTEATFVLMYSTIFSSVDATSIMILWRVMTFYLVLVIGSIVFAWAKTQKDVPVDTEERVPTTFAPEVYSGGEEIQES